MRYGKLQNEMRDAGRGYRPPASGNTSPFPLPPSAFPLRRGVTLIEMLIVLFIISLLAAVALRALPGEEQRPRESARMLSAYLSLAKSQAAATGRSVGVILTPSTTTTYDRYSTLVQQCEIPPTYSGDTISASKILALDSTMVPANDGSGPVNYCQDNRQIIKLLVPVGELAENIIRYGDKIQLDSKGPIYTICWDGRDGIYTAPPNIAFVPEGVVNGAGTLIMLKNSLAIPTSTPTVPAPLMQESDSGKKWPYQYNFPNTLKSGNPDPNGYITCTQNPPASMLPALPPNNYWVGNFCLTCYLDPRDQQPLPWPTVIPYNTFFSITPPIPPFSFTIIRQAVKSATAPMSLPAGAGIDMAFSGIDNGLLFYKQSTTNPTLSDLTRPPVTILFSPNGSVEQLNINGTQFKPTQTIHLLLGKLTVSMEPDKNWYDLNNYILSINPQTGTVSTNTVYPPFYNSDKTNNPGPPYPHEPRNVNNQFDPTNLPPYSMDKLLTDPANDNFMQALFYSRKYAREAQTTGGKR